MTCMILRSELHAFIVRSDDERRLNNSRYREADVCHELFRLLW
jgi:hypothetical protein